MGISFFQEQIKYLRLALQKRTPKNGNIQAYKKST